MVSHSAIFAQATIFFCLLSSAALKYDPQTLADSSNIDAVLTMLTVLAVTLPIIEKASSSRIARRLSSAIVALSPRSLKEATNHRSMAKV